MRRRTRSLTFRVKLWPVLLVYIALYLSAALVPAALMTVMTADYVSLFGCSGCVFTAAWMAAVGMAWRSVRLYPVSLDAAALDGFDVLGFPVAVGWEGFRDARPLWLFGLRYLRVRSLAHRHVLWLPLHLADFDAFVDAVAAYAGEDHPLTGELMRWADGE